jgi:hypothetical protein
MKISFDNYVVDFLTNVEISKIYKNNSLILLPLQQIVNIDNMMDSFLPNTIKHRFKNCLEFYNMYDILFKKIYSLLITPYKIYNEMSYNKYKCLIESGIELNTIYFVGWSIRFEKNINKYVSHLKNIYTLIDVFVDLINIKNLPEEIIINIINFIA